MLCEVLWLFITHCIRASRLTIMDSLCSFPLLCIRAILRNWNLLVDLHHDDQA
jgi:hypothetical protein